MTRRLVAAIVVAAILAGCGSSTPVFTSAAAATRYWDAQISKLAHGTMSRDDGRGCAKIGAQRFSCAGYLRNAQDSLSSGRNVLGGVVVKGAKIHVDGHPATNRAMDRWLHRFRGDPLP